MEIAARHHPAFSWRRENLEGNIVLFQVSGMPTEEGVREFLNEVESFFRSLESRAQKIEAVVDLAQMEATTASHRSHRRHRCHPHAVQLHPPSTSAGATRARK